MSNKMKVQTGFLPKWWTAWLGLAAVACALLLPTGSRAQSPSGERVYVDLGRWTVYSTNQTRTCTMRYSGSNTTRLVMAKTGADASQLTLQLADTPALSGDLVFGFDDATFPALITNRRVFKPDASGSQVEDAFRQARMMTLKQGEDVIFSLSLDTSSAGLRLLRQCAEQGWLGMRQGSPSTPATRPAAREQVPAPAPAYSAPAPETRTAPSLARGAEPINPSNWIRNTQSLRFPSRGWDGGILGFTLMVDAAGRASQCVVDRSSGSRDLDSQLCRQLVRNARFNPALDASGASIAGQYSSSVRLSLPE